MCSGRGARDVHRAVDSMQPRNQWLGTRRDPGPKPAFRRLRGYAFDPSLSLALDTAFVNEVVFKVPWEDDGEALAQSAFHGVLRSYSAGDEPEAGLFPGPVGDTIEVIDFDAPSNCFYEPVNLNAPLVLAQDGLPPSEGNPQFHQQMVYAVAMTTLRNFERALGRFALWAHRRTGKERYEYVQRLRIYPHALREANAYYSPAKVALLFGYFPSGAAQAGMVFTCLSHDIIAHETTHALLDGMHARFLEATNPDTLAFHEAFADIVALFQHFSFPEVLRHQIARTRGDLATQNMLGQLAQEFGHAIGQKGALRDALGMVDAKTGEWRPATPDPEALAHTFEPHARGAILVAAVFEAFLSIYKRRVEDLVRIASAGSGILQPGALHPDLVNRLAAEAAKSAQHVLTMCIRALDYCPPVDITFGDYLRAVITADSDLVPDDDRGYRLAFIDAFRRRGIYPDGIRTLSVESLRWPLTVRALVEMDEGAASQLIAKIARVLGDPRHGLASALRGAAVTRRAYYEQSRQLASRLHELLEGEMCGDFEAVVGGAVAISDPPPDLERGRTGKGKFEVHSVRPVQRVGPDGDALNHAVVVLTQKRLISSESSAEEKWKFRGGVTLIFNLDTLDLQYAITKSIRDDRRVRRQEQFRTFGPGGALRGVYGTGPGTDEIEPFAALHAGHEERVP